ncbi:MULTISPECIES: hypothetical protein [unclassified Variovorax]|uniref:hypothetical protein n=1 Tax=unclassified Variovorax TaxID=663243 RepID=UPI00076DA13D|nr:MULTISPECIES: hypothetical protein [unclassified Variovorax]KWT95591.1 hypothetical protein APY03_2468 [Variovorax sp. WDL1]PNG50203.1 hypothetical protein CHC06_05826 [Variovorax sp. B2]PNG51076.1 hypothetical protein CHC07_05732 [Variovorax sp. B4]VTU42324.1 hypothetical protein SRS16P1_00241 [Variovorax sp. SRS16]VTU42350.1 hypothetical protein E5P1_00239 [Variovorax sp. PBL-E5]
MTNESAPEAIESSPVLSPAEAEALAQDIVALADYTRGYFSRIPGPGEFLVTGFQQGRRDALSRIGFCVQVRKGVGQFSSDIVFMRHAAGKLSTHENQSFIPMSPYQLKLARKLFAGIPESNLPEDEDMTHGYRCQAGIHEVGHIIENSASRAAPTAGVVLLNVTEANGSVSSTAFI